MTGSKTTSQKYTEHGPTVVINIWKSVRFGKNVRGNYTKWIDKNLP